MATVASMHDVNHWRSGVGGGGGPLSLPEMKLDPMQIEQWWDVHPEDLDNPNRRYSGRVGATPLVQRCIRSLGWSETFALRTLRGYRQYMELKCVMNDWTESKLLAPVTIQQMLHQHLLDNLNYTEDCLLLFGRVMGHDPDAMAFYERRVLANRVKTTMIAFQARYGNDLDPDVWDYGELGELAMEDGDMVNLASLIDADAQYESRSNVNPVSRNMLGRLPVASIERSNTFERMQVERSNTFERKERERERHERERERQRPERFDRVSSQRSGLDRGSMDRMHTTPQPPISNDHGAFATPSTVGSSRDRDRDTRARDNSMERRQSTASSVEPELIKLRNSEDPLLTPRTNVSASSAPAAMRTTSPMRSMARTSSPIRSASVRSGSPLKGSMEPITIVIREAETGEETFFAVRARSALRIAFSAYAERKGLRDMADSLRFSWSGKNLTGYETPYGLGMEERARIDVVVVGGRRP